MTETVFVGRSRAHRALVARLSRLAMNDAEILITGPSGVGKEICARLAHEQSRRAGGPFVPVNCGALPPELFENEMFGHASGAFTGAGQRAGGLVAEAEGGTLFLDELEALHPTNQVKLLRLIQEKEYRPLGEVRLRKIDVRFIGATNRDLVAESRANRFRIDLLFRLRVLPVDVPPLQERVEDIPPLLEHFISKYSAEYCIEPIIFTERAMKRLLSYAWPGNVRELENAVRSLLCTHTGGVVDVEDLPLLEEYSSSEVVDLPRCAEPLPTAKRRVVGAFERSYLEDMLARNGGNISAAARASGKNRRAFFELMRRHGVDAARFKAPCHVQAVPAEVDENVQGEMEGFRRVAGPG